MSLIFLFIGVILGYFVSLYLPWVARKVFKRKAKSELVFYNIDTGEVRDTRDSDSNSLRIVIIRDLLTATITINFTDFYGKENVRHRVHKQYHFPFYGRWGNSSDDYITHLKNGRYSEFLEKDIFFVPSAKLSSPLKSVREVLNIPED